MQIHHLPTTLKAPGAARVTGLFVSTIFLAGVAGAQSDVRIPAQLPHFDVDAKTEHWVAPLKDGLAPSSRAHLSLEERAAADRAIVELVHPRRTVRGAGDVSTKPGEALDPRHTQSGVDPRAVHQMERAPDGTVWAIGGTYKARFGADGASYVPFLGSAAPRNFPVTFRTTEVTLGGEALGFDHTSSPQLSDDSAVYERGAFVERYDTRAGSLEQLYVFDELPGSGELVVRIAVESELVGSAAADGLAWSNELGAVTYSSAIAIDGRGRRVAAPTVLVDGFVELRVPASFVASAVLPLTIDPVLATYTPSGSATSDDYDPDIAYDNANGVFCIIWNRVFSASDHDVWAEMFDPFGTPVAGSGAYIDFTSTSWSQAKVANNRIDTQFLVVATRAGTPSEIWGRTREAESVTQSAQFQVSSGSGSKSSPDVGGDPHTASPTYYCVVWEREFSLAVDHDVHARLVTAAGTLLGTSEILIDNSGGSYDKFPTVSKSDGVSPAGTQEWNVAWQREFSASDWDIRGAQIHWDGTITHGSFSVDFSGQNDLAPKPSSPLDPAIGPRTYLIVYQRLDGADWDIYASALRGATRFTHDNLSALWVTGAAQDEFTPVVDSNGIHFAVAYHRRFGTSTSDFDVYVAGVYLVGNVFRIAEGPLNLAFSGTFEGNAELCARRSGGTVSDFCGVAWVDSGTERNIEGALYEMLDGFGQVAIDYCSPIPNSTGFTSALLATGSSVVTRNELNLEASRLPLNSTVFFLTSRTQGFVANPGGSQGNLCLGGSIGRFVGPGQILNSGATGSASLFLDLTQQPTPTGLVQVQPGETWNFQGWHRDSSGGGATSNLTNGSTVMFF